MSPSMWNAGPVRIDFRGSPRPTLGVEWEFALVDKKTRDLTNSAAALFPAVGPDLPDQARLHKALLRNPVELVTGVCCSVGKAMADRRGPQAVVLPAPAALRCDPSR